MHAEVAVRAMQAGKDVLIELPLATTLEDAHRIVAAQQASGRQAFVDMFSRFSPANQQLRQAVADERYGPLRVLEIEGRLISEGTGSRSQVPGEVVMPNNGHGTVGPSLDSQAGTVRHKGRSGG